MVGHRWIRFDFRPECDRRRNQTVWVNVLLSVVSLASNVPDIPIDEVFLSLDCVSLLGGTSIMCTLCVIRALQGAIEARGHERKFITDVCLFRLRLQAIVSSGL